MQPQPTSEHEFFNDMLGQWTMEHVCDMGPDQPSSTSHGTMTAKTLGGLWIIIDCEGDVPEGGKWESQFTLGYDPQEKRFLGTFVASMMTHLWLYSGQLDASRRRLVLDAHGPKFDGTGMANYQDIFEVVDHDHWILRSQIQNEDGTWTPFLEGHHRRVPA